MKKTLIVSLLLVVGASSSWAKPGGWIKDFLNNSSISYTSGYYPQTQVCYERPVYYSQPVYYPRPVVIYEAPRYYNPPTYVPMQPYQNFQYYQRCR